MITWLAGANFQSAVTRINSYEIFMSNRGGFNINVLSMPYDNPYLESAAYYLDQFLSGISFEILNY